MLARASDPACRSLCLSRVIAGGLCPLLLTLIDFLCLCVCVRQALLTRPAAQDGEDLFSVQFPVTGTHLLLLLVSTELD